MELRTRSKILFLLTLLIASSFLQPPPAAAEEWTITEKEKFLRTAEVVSWEELSTGITRPLRVTLSDGHRQHDAHVQSVDELHRTHQTRYGAEVNFEDSYRYNIAAYRLDRLLGLGMVPVCVERNVQNEDSAVCWWVDDVIMSERDRFLDEIEPPDPKAWNLQMYIVRVFDQLIYNTDRNLGNLLIADGWKLWMIDHTRAFHFRRELLDEDNLVRCDRRLLETLRNLNPKEVSEQLRPFLTEAELEALMSRRDKIVAFFEKRIEEKGEGAVLFDYLDRRQ